MQPHVSPHLLTRSSHRSRAAPGLRFLGDLTLSAARTHEICGPARRTLAIAIARATEGPVFWITPGWTSDRLHPPAISRWVDPGRFVFFDVKRPEDLMWTMEEALRSGHVPLAVADLPSPPELTPVRRLHLAAETGAAAGQAPLGLLLTPGGGGAPGIESRWAMAPRHGADGRTAWQLDRLRARTLPPKHWDVVPGATGGLALKEPADLTAPGGAA